MNTGDLQYVAGSLLVGGNVTVVGTLTQGGGGAPPPQVSLSVIGPSTLATDQASTTSVGGPLVVGAPASLQPVTINGPASITGNVVAQGTVAVGGAFTVTGSSTFTGNVGATADIVVGGAAKCGGLLTVDSYNPIAPSISQEYIGRSAAVANQQTRFSQFSGTTEYRTIGSSGGVGGVTTGSLAGYVQTPGGLVYASELFCPSAVVNDCYMSYSIPLSADHSFSTVGPFTTTTSVGNNTTPTAVAANGDSIATGISGYFQFDVAGIVVMGLLCPAGWTLTADSFVIVTPANSLAGTSDANNSYYTQLDLASQTIFLNWGPTLDGAKFSYMFFNLQKA